MGIFEKFKFGFKKSAENIKSGLREIIVKKEIDDDTLNKIEDFLISSDCFKRIVELFLFLVVNTSFLNVSYFLLLGNAIFFSPPWTPQNPAKIHQKSI